MIKNIIGYFFAKGLPGVINLFSLSLYTRLLSPENFGFYSVIISSVGLLSTFSFSWLNICISRFYHEAKGKDIVNFVRVINSLYLLISLLVISLCSFLYLTGIYEELYFLFFFCSITILQSYNAIVLEFYRSGFEVKKYGAISFLRSISTVVLFISIVFIDGEGKYALLFSVVGSYLICMIFTTRKLLCYGITSIRFLRIKKYISYGFPFAISALVSYVVSSSDRLLLMRYSGAEDVGLYSASYDLGFNSLNMFFLIIGLATYPRIVNIFESKGKELAKVELDKTLNVIIGIAFPIVIAFYLSLNSISDLMLGHEYIDVALKVLPIICLSSIFYALSNYCFYVVFHIYKKTYIITIISLFCAILNLVINVAFIPSYGYIAAAYSTLVSYFVVLVASIFISHLYIKIEIFSLNNLILIFSLVTSYFISSFLYSTLQYGLDIVVYSAIFFACYFIQVVLFNAFDFRVFFFEKCKLLIGES
ncbi:hypothetical protein ACX06_13000 [Vibrio parahaemolyticus]|uniref:oligosaccharide flippase family protein n=1 Tax=Vibrio parahaemolyticus TaxID=670 RepID=UPI0006B29FC0|nr:oligosaccharide flippase family protein [Vibrio parahaemolyticus]KOY22929.1 hypothetical protein ACX06_13000 [Vibrio parahaemolyticus]